MHHLGMRDTDESSTNATGDIRRLVAASLIRDDVPQQHRSSSSSSTSATTFPHTNDIAKGPRESPQRRDSVYVNEALLVGKYEHALHEDAVATTHPASSSACGVGALASGQSSAARVASTSPSQRDIKGLNAFFIPSQDILDDGQETHQGGSAQRINVTSAEWWGSEDATVAAAGRSSLAVVEGDRKPSGLEKQRSLTASLPRDAHGEAFGSSADMSEMELVHRAEGQASSLASHASLSEAFRMGAAASPKAAQPLPLHATSQEEAEEVAAIQAALDAATARFNDFSSEEDHEDAHALGVQVRAGAAPMAQSRPTEREDSAARVDFSHRVLDSARRGFVERVQDASPPRSGTRISPREGGDRQSCRPARATDGVMWCTSSAADNASATRPLSLLPQKYGLTGDGACEALAEGLAPDSCMSPASLEGGESDSSFLPLHGPSSSNTVGTLLLHTGSERETTTALTNLVQQTAAAAAGATQLLPRPSSSSQLQQSPSWLSACQLSPSGIPNATAASPAASASKSALAHHRSASVSGSSFASPLAPSLWLSSPNQEPPSLSLVQGVQAFTSPPPHALQPPSASSAAAGGGGGGGDGGDGGTRASSNSSNVHSRTISKGSRVPTGWDGAAMSSRNLNEMASTMFASPATPATATSQAGRGDYVTALNSLLSSPNAVSLQGYQMPLMTLFAEQQQQQQHKHSPQQQQQQQQYANPNVFLYSPPQAYLSNTTPAAAATGASHATAITNSAASSSAAYQLPAATQQLQQPQAVAGGTLTPSLSSAAAAAAATTSIQTSRASRNLYFRNLPRTWNTAVLRELCSGYGAVMSAKVAHHPVTNESLGYGFVLFEKTQCAAVCVATLNHALVHMEGEEARTLLVRMAHPSAAPGFQEDPDEATVAVAAAATATTAAGPRGERGDRQPTSPLSGVTLRRGSFHSHATPSAAAGIATVVGGPMQPTSVLNSPRSRGSSFAGGMPLSPMPVLLGSNDSSTTTFAAEVRPPYTYPIPNGSTTSNEMQSTHVTGSGGRSHPRTPADSNDPSFSFPVGILRAGAVADPVGAAVFYPCLPARSPTHSLSLSQQPQGPGGGHVGPLSTAVAAAATAATSARDSLTSPLPLSPSGGASLSSTGTSPKATAAAGRDDAGPTTTTTTTSTSATSTRNLYITNLPLTWNTTKLRDLCAPFGAIISANVAHHPKTNESRGYGFVLFSNAKDAAACVAGLHQLTVPDTTHVLSCRFAKEKATPSIAHVTSPPPGDGITVVGGALPVAPDAAATTAAAQRGGAQDFVGVARFTSAVARPSNVADHYFSPTCTDQNSATNGVADAQRPFNNNNSSSSTDARDAVFMPIEVFSTLQERVSAQALQHMLQEQQQQQGVRESVSPSSADQISSALRGASLVSELSTEQQDALEKMMRQCVVYGSYVPEHGFHAVRPEEAATVGYRSPSRRPSPRAISSGEVSEQDTVPPSRRADEASAAVVRTHAIAVQPAAHSPLTVAELKKDKDVGVGGAQSSEKALSDTAGSMSNRVKAPSSTVTPAGALAEKRWYTCTLFASADAAAVFLSEADAAAAATTSTTQKPAKSLAREVGGRQDVESSPLMRYGLRDQVIVFSGPQHVATSSGESVRTTPPRRRDSATSTGSVAPSSTTQQLSNQPMSPQQQMHLTTNVVPLPPPPPPPPPYSPQQASEANSIGSRTGAAGLSYASPVAHTAPLDAGAAARTNLLAYAPPQLSAATSRGSADGRGSRSPTHILNSPQPQQAAISSHGAPVSSPASARYAFLTPFPHSSGGAPLTAASAAGAAMAGQRESGAQLPCVTYGTDRATSFTTYSLNAPPAFSTSIAPQAHADASTYTDGHHNAPRRCTGGSEGSLPLPAAGGAELRVSTATPASLPMFAALSSGWTTQTATAAPSVVAGGASASSARARTSPSSAASLTFQSTSMTGGGSYLSGMSASHNGAGLSTTTAPTASAPGAGMRVAWSGNVPPTGGALPPASLSSASLAYRSAPSDAPSSGGLAAQQ